MRRTSTELRLSAPARETLAIVAYRQPIMRADVEGIRGVQCSEVLRQLMEKGLVRIAGRDQSLGRPVLYGTTRKFLQVFGLKSLKDLPRAEQLQVPKKAEKEEVKREENEA
jgi:segregation and condensation protein B